VIGLHTVSGLVHGDTNVTVVAVQNCAGQPSPGLPTVALATVAMRERRLVAQIFPRWNRGSNPCVPAKLIRHVTKHRVATRHEATAIDNSHSRSKSSSSDSLKNGQRRCGRVPWLGGATGRVACPVSSQRTKEPPDVFDEQLGFFQRSENVRRAASRSVDRRIPSDVSA
jgi:hypothetical protein